MEVGSLHWIFIYIYIVVTLDVAESQKTCQDRISTVKNAATKINDQIEKQRLEVEQLENTLRQLEHDAASIEKRAEQAANVLTTQKIEYQSLLGNTNLVRQEHETLLIPSRDTNNLFAYASSKRADAEANNIFLVDTLRRGQLQLLELNRNLDAFTGWKIHAQEIAQFLQSEASNCTESLTLAKYTEAELLYLNAQIAGEKQYLDAKTLTLADEEVRLQTMVDESLTRCIPTDLRYIDIAQIEGQAIQPTGFLQEYCDMYNQGALHDCQKEFKTLSFELSNKTHELNRVLTEEESLKCKLKKKKVEYAKCTLEYWNCRGLTEQYDQLIENPYGHMDTKTSQAIKLYNKILEVRKNKSYNLMKTVQVMGRILKQEANTATNENRADYPYKMENLAITEYIIQATRFLCGLHNTQCEGGTVCNLKTFADMQSNKESRKSFEEMLTSLQMDLELGEILPYAEFQSLEVYNILNNGKRHEIVNELEKKLWQRMKQIKVEDLFLSKESVHTKTIAWLADGEKKLWLTLTPQLRLFISDVANVIDAVQIGGPINVNHLVSCTCPGDFCHIDQPREHRSQRPS